MSNAANQNGSGLEQRVSYKKAKSLYDLVYLTTAIPDSLAFNINISLFHKFPYHGF